MLQLLVIVVQEVQLFVFCPGQWALLTRVFQRVFGGPNVEKRTVQSAQFAPDPSAYRIGRWCLAAFPHLQPVPRSRSLTGRTNSLEN